jgi:hypothetical protein
MFAQGLTGEIGTGSVTVVTTRADILDGFERIQEIAKKLQDKLEIPKHIEGRPDMVHYEAHDVAIADLEEYIDDILQRMRRYDSKGKIDCDAPMRSSKKVLACLNCFCAWLQSLDGDYRKRIDYGLLRDVLDWLCYVMQGLKWCDSEVDIIARTTEILM